MKLSEATEQDKIKALAELDGYSWSQSETDSEWCWRDNKAKYIGTIPNYLTSYDAIIPLVQKQDADTMIRFWDFVKPERLVQNKSYLFLLTPSQLADALLIATGKFEL